jgi:hypothetical protein
MMWLQEGNAVLAEPLEQMAHYLKLMAPACDGSLLYRYHQHSPRPNKSTSRRGELLLGRLLHPLITSIFP